MMLALRSAVVLGFLAAGLAFGAVSMESDQGHPLEWAGPASLKLVSDSKLEVAGN